MLNLPEAIVAMTCAFLVFAFLMIFENSQRKHIELGKGSCSVVGLAAADGLAKDAGNNLRKESLVLKLQCGGTDFATTQVDVVAAWASTRPASLKCTWFANKLATCEAPATVVEAAK